MPKLKAGTILPTPAEDAAITAAALADQDTAPFTDAEWEQVKPLVRRGRPLGSGTKAQVTLRLDVEVLESSKHRAMAGKPASMRLSKAGCRRTPDSR